MKILLIKMSSLGDVIHTLPALTDALQHFPDLQCDWLVEENFSEIPFWHPAVKRVIPIALRRWRKQLWQQPRTVWQQWREMQQQLAHSHYDSVLDAQGLLKSAVLTRFAKGVRVGFNADSAREPLAARFYQRTYAVERNLHAVDRLRYLFAAALGYALTPDALEHVDYGLNARFPALASVNSTPYLVFLHGTTWATKHWYETHWEALARQVTAAGYRVKLPFGNTAEFERATRLANAVAGVEIVPKSTLSELAQLLAQAKAVVGVDTGLSHLAAALAVPTISLYGATNPAKTGTRGQHQIHLTADFACAPCLKKVCDYQGTATEQQPACYSRLSVARVWEALQKLI